jgi:hypothetical protein
LLTLKISLKGENKMSKILDLGKEILRIDPANPQKLQYSTNGGRMWLTRYQNAQCGNFTDLLDNGKELLAQTSKGLYYSTSGGRMWIKRS